MTRAVFGGIEGGGTKFVCALGTGPDDIVERVRIPTTSPRETLSRVVDFFARERGDIALRALGIASFGPLDLRRDSPSFGRVTRTPKSEWDGADLLVTLQHALSLPTAIDTDVNGAALGEWHWGAGRNDHNGVLVYVTVGTGVGGGAVIEGRTLRGNVVHPEMGHVLMPAFDDDTFPGICPFHGRCLEGLASGPAIEARTGTVPESLPHDHPTWDLAAKYIACGLHSMVSILAPTRIVLGGGVGSAPRMIERVRTALRQLDGHYTDGLLGSARAAENYLVASELGTDAGILGAFVLARQALDAE